MSHNESGFRMNQESERIWSHNESGVIVNQDTQPTGFQNKIWKHESVTILAQELPPFGLKRFRHFGSRASAILAQELPQFWLKRVQELRRLTQATCFQITQNNTHNKANKTQTQNTSE